MPRPVLHAGQNIIRQEQLVLNVQLIALPVPAQQRANLANLAMEFTMVCVCSVLLEHISVVIKFAKSFHKRCKTL